MFSRENADKLFQFIGFGNLDGPIWFLGMEEGGGNEDTLRARLAFDPIMDLEEAQRELGNSRHFGSKPDLQSTWSVLCKIALGLNGAPNDTESVRRYQATRLGTARLLSANCCRCQTRVWITGFMRTFSMIHA
jgi:hypothetical protein